MPAKTKIFVSLLAILGLADLAFSAVNWHLYEPRLFLSYLTMAVLSSVVQVRQSSAPVSFYLNVPFILISMAQLTAPEAVVVGCSAVLTQSLLDRQIRRSPLRVFLAVTVAATIIASADFVTAALLPRSLQSVTVRLFVGAGAFFVANTLPGAIALRFARPQRLGTVWRKAHFWSFPYYLVSACITAVALGMRQGVSLDSALLALPAVYLAFRYYRTQKAQCAEKERHAREMAALHLRAIEGLACAVEAKDLLNTKGHLRRVQLYCLEIGKEFGLSGENLEALRAGALLHDVGKLAVPEHILAKPGRLTPEEFAKMKIHPVVGAEIVEQVKFPYPVAPIVRAHHEKWDGTGYPLGLRGGAIPLGARILSAVDCLDALTSDREYHKALSFDEAMHQIRSESGTSFDPGVVEAVGRRYQDLERLAKTLPETAPASPLLDTSTSTAPGAGFDLAGSAAGDHPLDFLSMISAARNEDRFLLEITENLGASLDLEQTFTRVRKSLQGVIPHHALVVFIREANTLLAQFASGSNAGTLAYLEVPMGSGLSGWVAENASAVVNGNPSVDPDFICAPDQPLRSALAIPLEGRCGVLGVLALYHRDRDGFTRDHLRMLQSVNSRITQAVENALKYREADTRANTDPLTGLPNASLLALALKAELTRARRLSHPFAVVSCELSGLRGVYRTHGPAAGDYVVQRVASALKNDCRAYDHLGRLGREQFAFVLPGMKPEVLATKLSRLNAIANSLALPSALAPGGAGSPISFRFGQAFYPDDGDREGVLLEVARYRAAESQSASTLAALGTALAQEQAQRPQACAPAPEDLAPAPEPAPVKGDRRS